MLLLAKCWLDIPKKMLRLAHLSETLAKLGLVGPRAGSFHGPRAQSSVQPGCLHCSLSGMNQSNLLKPKSYLLLLQLQTSHLTSNPDGPAIARVHGLQGQPAGVGGRGPQHGPTVCICAWNYWLPVKTGNGTLHLLPSLSISVMPPAVRRGDLQALQRSKKP